MKGLKHPALWFSLYMGLLGGSYLPYHTVLPIRIAHHLIITALLIWWLWKDGLPNTLLLYPMGALGLVSGFSAFQAIDFRMALENWWHFLTNGLLLLMLISWNRKGWGENLFNAHFAIGGVIFFVSLLEWLQSPLERPGGTFFLISLTGAYVAALLLPLFVWAWQEKRGVLFLVGAGLSGVLMANQSRGALLSVGVAVITFLLLRYRVRWQILTLGAGIALLMGMSLFGMTSQQKHWAGDIIRVDLWRSALAMVRDYPLAGVGPGMFGQAFRYYRSVKDDNMVGAHNFYLNTLAELGISGGAASLVVGLSFWRSLARKHSPKQDAILAALVGVGAQLLFDNFPSSNLVFLLSVYISYLVQGRETPRPRYALQMAATASLLLMVYLFNFLQWDTAQFFYEQSLSGNLAEARAASELDQFNRLYQIQVARLEGKEVTDIDPTLNDSTDLRAYGVTNYGRPYY